MDLDAGMERFWSKVDRSGGPDACWPWQGYQLRGYGRWRAFETDHNRSSHRVAWEAEHGPVPEGMQLDHLCRNPPCCNPAHLEVVTPRENQARIPGGMIAANIAKTHCKRGHPLSGDNLYAYTYRGRPKRNCRTCKAQNGAELFREGAKVPAFRRAGTDEVCVNGHPRTEANTYRHGRWVTCRVCNREAAARSKDRRLTA